MNMDEEMRYINTGMYIRISKEKKRGNKLSSKKKIAKKKKKTSAEKVKRKI